MGSLYLYLFSQRQPRQLNETWLLVCADVTPSAVHVGNIVQGVRMAWAQGRDLGAVDDDSDAAKKVSSCSLTAASL